MIVKNESSVKKDFINCWTDYPIGALGDAPYVKAPVRKVRVISWDGDKYCCVSVSDGEKEVHTNFKRWYLYTQEGRNEEVPQISKEELSNLPEDCPFPNLCCAEDPPPE